MKLLVGRREHFSIELRSLGRKHNVLRYMPTYDEKSFNEGNSLKQFRNKFGCFGIVDISASLNSKWIIFMKK